MYFLPVPLGTHSPHVSWDATSQNTAPSYQKPKARGERRYKCFTVIPAQVLALKMEEPPVSSASSLSYVTLSLQVSPAYTLDI